MVRSSSRPVWPAVVQLKLDRALSRVTIRKGGPGGVNALGPLAVATTPVAWPTRPTPRRGPVLVTHFAREVHSEDAAEKGERLKLDTRRYVGARRHGDQLVKDSGDAEIISQHGMGVSQHIGRDRPGRLLCPVGHQLPPVPQRPHGVLEWSTGEVTGVR